MRVIGRRGDACVREATEVPAYQPSPNCKVQHKTELQNCNGLDWRIGHSGKRTGIYENLRIILHSSMTTINERAKPRNTSLSLLTDLYQLTMACAYWKSGTADKVAAFHLSFRKPPFDSGFTIACGLSAAIEFRRNYRCEPSDLAYLATIAGRDNQPLFEDSFLNYLGKLRFTCDGDAMPEGTVVLPHEPLLRVQGPILQAQLLETPLLNFLNFQSLIATKAARICLAAKGEPVIEFGLRRAQGIDGGLTASRAAYLGGCAGTSSVLAGKIH